MKSLFPHILAAIFFSSSLAAAPATIDLTKPVLETLQPDILYWTFDGGEIGVAVPGTVKDLSGNDFTGDLKGEGAQLQPNYVPGKFGTTGLQVEGTPHSRPCVEFTQGKRSDSDVSKLDFANTSFTAGAWVKVGDLDASTERRNVIIFNTLEWQFILIRIGGEWKLGFNGSWRSFANASLSIVEDKEWHHLAFSVDTTADGGRNTVIFWLDGQRLGDAQTFDVEIPSPKPRRTRVTVGRSTLTDNASFDDAFITSGIHSFQR